MSSRSPSDFTSLDPILTAARQIIAAEGVKRLTMARLMAATGLSRATLYRRSGGREAILQQLAAEPDQPWGDLGQTDMRSRILLAVRQAIRSSGTLNVTIEQVAAAADVGVATIYRHFGDKQSLLQAFSEELTPRRGARDLLQHPSGDIRADLMHFATIALSFIIEYRDFAGLLIKPDEQSEALLGHLHDNQNRTLIRLKEYFTHQIAAGRLIDVDPFDLAAAFSGILFGLTLIKSSYIGQIEPDPAALAPLAVDLFLTGSGLETTI